MNKTGYVRRTRASLWNYDSLPKPASSLTTSPSEASTSIAPDSQMEEADLELYGRAVAYASENRRVSRLILQREFKIGGVKANWLIGMLDAAGILERPSPSPEVRVRDGQAIVANFFSEYRPIFYEGSSSPQSLESSGFIDKLSQFEKNGFIFWKIIGGDIYLAVRHIEIAQKFIENNSHLLLEFHGVISQIDLKYWVFAFTPYDMRKLDADEKWKLLKFSPNTYIAIPEETDEYDALKGALIRALQPVLSESPLEPSQQAEFIGDAIRRVEDLRSANEATTLSIERANGEALSLPAKAPALWVHDKGNVSDPDTGKQRLENASEFTRRVYGPWLGNGMTRNLLRKLDNSLLQALYRTYGTNLPDDIPLPTKKDENSRWVARVEEEGLAAVIPVGSPEFVLKEAQRLLSARQRRNQGKT